MGSTHSKNIRQIGSSPQVGVNIKNLWNHHLVMFHCGVSLLSGNRTHCSKVPATVRLDLTPNQPKELMGRPASPCKAKLKGVTLREKKKKTWEQEGVVGGFNPFEKMLVKMGIIPK